jgi:hypothetical protein
MILCIFPDIEEKRTVYAYIYLASSEMKYLIEKKILPGPKQIYQLFIN